MVVQGELTRVQEIIHNNLIMQQEKDKWQSWSIVLGGSLNLLVEEVIMASHINLLCNG